MWVRIDDHFDDHWKTAAVGPLGEAMLVNALCWCNRTGSGGRVPKSKISKLVNVKGISVNGKPADPEQIAQSLVEARFFVPDGDAYLIHDYDEYQLTPRHIREARSEAGRKGAAARWGRSEPMNVGELVDRVHTALLDRYAPEDVLPAVEELRMRLRAGEHIVSPVKFAQHHAEKHREARDAEARRQDRERQRFEARRLGALCDHGLRRAECEQCTEVDARAREQAIADAKKALGGRP